VSGDSFAMLGFWCEAPFDSFDSFVVPLLCSTFFLALCLSAESRVLFFALSALCFAFFAESCSRGTHIF
jgi:hypothetical protein